MNRILGIKGIAVLMMATFINLSIGQDTEELKFKDFLELAISGDDSNVLALSNELEKISLVAQKETGNKVGVLMSLLCLSAIKDNDLAKYSLYQKLLFNNNLDMNVELAFSYIKQLANDRESLIHIESQKTLDLLFPTALSDYEEKLARELADNGVYYDIRRHAENYRLGLSYERDILKSLDFYLYAYLHGDVAAFPKLQELILSLDISEHDIADVAEIFDQVAILNADTLP